MDSSTLKEIIGLKKPRYKIEYKKLVESISNKGDATGKGDFSSFGAFYQTFMYAFIIGYKLNKCIPFSKGEQTTDFAPISVWSPSGLREYVIMILLNESEKWNVSFKWIELEDANEETVNNFVTELIRCMEGYANAGYEYLQNKFDNENYEFQDSFVFVNILEEISK
jgi:hypothetical protein